MMLSILTLAGAAGCGGASAGATSHGSDDSGAIDDASVPWDGTFPDAAATGDAAADAMTLPDAAVPDAALVDASTTLVAGWAWTYPSSDPLNATPPLLAAYADGVVLAGASSDPAVVGVTSFPDAAIKSEAFVKRLQHDGGPMWTTPLHGVGMPTGVAVTASGTTVVVGPWLPGQSTISPSFVGTDMYLGKFDADGKPIYEKDIAIPSSAGSEEDVAINGVAVDASDNVYVVGSIQRSSGAEAMLVMKLDSSANVLWTKALDGDGPGYEMLPLAVAVLPVTASMPAPGDVVVGGDFNGHVDFGGGSLSTLFDGTYETMAFLVRFTSAGYWVSNEVFGTGPGSSARALAGTSGGQVVVGGAMTGTATFGALSLATDFQSSAAYVAQLQQPTWSGQWGAIVADSGSPLVAGPMTSAVAIDSSGRVRTTGGTDGRRLVASFLLSTGTQLPDFTVDVGDASAGVGGTSLAIDSTQSVWVSGVFGEHATFGTLAQQGVAPPLAGDPISTFVARLDPSGP
jgi:hypothetical protein